VFGEASSFTRASTTKHFDYINKISQHSRNQQQRPKALSAQGIKAVDEVRISREARFVVAQHTFPATVMKRCGQSLIFTEHSQSVLVIGWV